ncbi:MAG: universal stress protein [Kofleriaceae bacterium]
MSEILESIREPIQVVVAYDFSPSAEHALMRAVNAAAEAPHHVLHVVVVLDPQRAVTYETADRTQQMIVERLSEAFANVPTAAEVQFFVHARIGRAATEILRLCAEVGADHVLLGSHGGRHRLLGSVSERVMREARCPVTTVREKTYEHVDLLKVQPFEHERLPHREPHRYGYGDNRVITRPPEWPIS